MYCFYYPYAPLFTLVYFFYPSNGEYVSELIHCKYIIEKYWVKSLLQNLSNKYQNKKL